MIVGMLLLSVVAVAGASPAAPTHAPCDPEFHLGHRVLSVGADQEVELWYPTLAEEKETVSATGWVSHQAEGAQVAACGPLPLVLFSHGFTGCRTQSTFLMEALARHGYVVAAVDHADARCAAWNQGKRPVLFAEIPFGEPARWSDTTYASRRKDLEAALDRLLLDPAWQSHLDKSRIGVAGHSLGGYTALGLGGAWPSWREERVRAVLAMAPYLTPYLQAHTLSKLTVPVMYQGGDRDALITPHLEGPQGAVATSASPKYYVKLANAGHFHWAALAACTSHQVSECTTLRSTQLLVDYALAFFDRHLKGLAAPLLDAPAPSGLTTFTSQAPRTH